LFRVLPLGEASNALIDQGEAFNESGGEECVLETRGDFGDEGEKKLCGFTKFRRRGKSKRYNNGVPPFLKLSVTLLLLFFSARCRSFFQDAFLIRR
jgi:hypothetical protein